MWSIPLLSRSSVRRATVKQFEMARVGTNPCHLSQLALATHRSRRQLLISSPLSNRASGDHVEDFFHELGTATLTAVHAIAIGGHVQDQTSGNVRSNWKKHCHTTLGQAADLSSKPTRFWQSSNLTQVLAHEHLNKAGQRRALRQAHLGARIEGLLLDLLFRSSFEFGVVVTRQCTSSSLTSKLGDSTSCALSVCLWCPLHGEEKTTGRRLPDECSSAVKPLNGNDKLHNPSGSHFGASHFHSR